MAARVQAFDWAATPLDAIECWPQSLKTLVSFLLQSQIPIVLLWGVDGVMIYNDAYSTFAGGRHPQLLGSKVREGWPEVADFNDNVMKVGLSGKTLAYKDQELTLFRHGKAEQVWMNLDYSPVLDDSGEPAGVIALVVETTERVLADRRIVLEQKRQQLLVRQMPGFVALLSGPTHVFDYVNDAYIAISGQRDFVGRPIREVFPELKDQGFFELLDKVYSSGQRFIAHSFPITLTEAKTEHFIDFLYEPIRDVDNLVTGIFVGGYDVTENHRIAAALRASESSLRELNASLERQVIERSQARGKTWQLSPELLGAVNMQGYFETSNPAWRTVLGWSEDEVASRSIFEMLHPDDLPRSREEFNSVAKGQPTIRFATRFRCKNGNYRWISWNGIPEDGRIYCSGRDITEEKEAEAELAFAQSALQQAQKMEAVGQLTGGIAHDFNNLLAGISGSLELIDRRLESGRTGDIKRYADAAQNSVRRAAALTQRLLAFSRRQTLSPKSTDVNHLIAGMEDLIRRTIGPSIELEVVGAGGLWLTLVDPSQLENTLLNLAINARDAMPNGGRMTIETANKWLDQRAAAERELPPGQYLSLCVTDTGIGMTPEVVSRAFDPFFTTKPLGEGTGLGLSMVHGFVRQSGGQVRIYSELGVGTTLCLYLPRFIGDLDTAEAPEAEGISATSGGETVLVIDDEEAIRMLITDILEEAGYRVLMAANGPAGLKILHSDIRIDLLLTDVGLPGGLNGRQVADAARNARPNLKVLFITGYAENAVIGNGHLDRGMQIITKPFAMAALQARVREIIES